MVRPEWRATVALSPMRLRSPLMADKYARRQARIDRMAQRREAERQFTEQGGTPLQVRSLRYLLTFVAIVGLLILAGFIARATGA